MAVAELLERKLADANQRAHRDNRDLVIELAKHGEDAEHLVPTDWSESDLRELTDKVQWYTHRQQLLAEREAILQAQRDVRDIPHKLTELKAELESLKAPLEAELGAEIQPLLKQIEEIKNSYRARIATATAKLARDISEQSERLESARLAPAEKVHRLEHELRNTSPRWLLLAVAELERQFRETLTAREKLERSRHHSQGELDLLTSKMRQYPGFEDQVDFATGILQRDEDRLAENASKSQEIRDQLSALRELQLEPWPDEQESVLPAG